MLNSVSYSSFLKTAEEKKAFINPIQAIKPVGNIASKAIGSAKSLLSNSWKGMTGFDKTMTVGLPLATTLPSMFDKKDQMGRSRAERLSTTGGNVVGGVAGMGMGNQLAKKITNAIPGKAGKILGGVTSVVGGVGGSLAGEAIGKAPFGIGKSQTQSYGSPPMQAPQMPMPGQTVQ